MPIKTDWIGRVHGMNISCPFLFLQEMAYGCMYDDILQCQCYLIGFRICACELFFWEGSLSLLLLVSSYYSTERGRERAGGGRWNRGRKKEMGGSLGGDHCCACEGGDVDIFEFIGGNKIYFLCHLIFSSPLSISHVTFLTVWNVSILITFLKCLQPPLFS